jgi:hypothetical protein
MSTVPSPGRAADIVGRTQDRLQQPGTAGGPANATDMWASLITLVPVGLVLGLLTFGRYAGRTPAPPTPGRVVPVALVAVLLGPVAVSVLGLFQWLLLVMILVGAILMVAMLRTPPLRH